MSSNPKRLEPETEPTPPPEETLGHFRDILLRLTFAAQGWDDRLDTVLARLQDDLRRPHQAPDLAHYAETLYRALMRAEENRPPRTPGEVVARTFRDLPVPEHLSELWHERLEQCRQSRDGIEAVEKLEACADLLRQALTLTGPASRRGGLLSSLFGGKESDQERERQFLKEVQHRLLELLGSLCPPTDLESRLETLKEEVGAGLSSHQIPVFIERITLLIQETRGRFERERLELEKFLGQLMERLNHIEGAVEASDASTREVFDNRRRLDAEIESHTQAMETQARAATDLNKLKQLVQERVDTIRERMEEHKQEEQALVQRSQEQMAQLMERLHEMESEAEQLRSQVKEERRQAFTDALTGLPNRFAWEERLDQEYARWKRYGSPLSLMIVDVDHFKRINDTYGHQSGDKALRIIARELAGSIRKTDFIARYGGEEIVILMPETPLPEAMKAADKLRRKVEDCGFHFRDQKVTITVSCGLSEFRGDDRPGDVFERADQALYEAKQNGRNQCMSA